MVTNWIDRLKSADRALQAGEFTKAKKSLDFLLDEMRSDISGGENAGQLLGLATLYRAIAQSGAGRVREAAWDFHVAQALYPAFAKADFGPYGVAGAALEGVRKDAANGEPPGPPGGRVTPPVKQRGEAPWFPRAKVDACEAQPVMVLSVVGTDGLLLRPRLLGAADPVLAFSAMDALRTWKFRPATMEGKPIQVIYTLTINYKLLYCANPAAVAAKKGGKP